MDEKAVNNKTKIRNYIILVAVGAVLILSVIAIVVLGKRAATISGDRALDMTFNAQGDMVVTGRLKNEGDVDANNVVLKITFDDKDNNVVFTATIKLSSILAKDTIEVNEIIEDVPRTTKSRNTEITFDAVRPFQFPPVLLFFVFGGGMICLFSGLIGFTSKNRIKKQRDSYSYGVNSEVDGKLRAAANLQMENNDCAKKFFTQNYEQLLISAEKPQNLNDMINHPNNGVTFSDEVLDKKYSDFSCEIYVDGDYNGLEEEPNMKQVFNVIHRVFAEKLIKYFSARYCLRVEEQNEKPNDLTYQAIDQFRKLFLGSENRQEIKTELFYYLYDNAMITGDLPEAYSDFIARYGNVQIEAIKKLESKSKESIKQLENFDENLSTKVGEEIQENIEKEKTEDMPIAENEVTETAEVAESVKKIAAKKIRR